MGKAFAGQTLCVSGKFSRSQADMKALVTDNGGVVAATANRDCTYLVADALGSAKTVKAQKDGLPIVTEEWLVKSIVEGKPSTDSSLFLSGGGGGAGAGAGKAKAAKASPKANSSPKAASAKKMAAPKRKKQSAAAGESDDEAAGDDDSDGGIPSGHGGPMGDGESDEESRTKKFMKTSTKKTSTATSTAKTKAPTAAASATKSGGPVFAGLVFTCSGKFSLGKAGMDALLESNGAKVTGSLGQKVTHVVSNIWPGDSEKTLRGAKLGLQCVDEAWVERCVASGVLEKESYDNSVNRADDNEPELCDDCNKELVKSAKQSATTLNMECPACGAKTKFAKQGKFARM